MKDNNVYDAASAHLRLFMLNQVLWPDERKACEKVLQIIEEYKK